MTNTINNSCRSSFHGHRVWMAQELSQTGHGRGRIILQISNGKAGRES